MVVNECKDPIFMAIAKSLDDFCQRLEDKLEKEQKQLEECKKKSELDLKIAHERKINQELSARLSELSRRETELDRVCTAFEAGLTITDSDRSRLEHAKKIHQLAKELTGIRLDFTAPPNMVKGYVKSESRRVLSAFEVPAARAPCELWVRAAAALLPPSGL